MSCDVKPNFLHVLGGRFEGGGQMDETNKRGITAWPRLTDVSPAFSVSGSLAWFDNVLAALDCYTWVFGESLLSPGELLGENRTLLY